MPAWQPMLAALFAPFGYPRAQLAHASRASRHNAALDLLERTPPRGVKITTLYPPADPPMGRFTTDPALVRRWAWAGWDEAHHAFGRTAPSPLAYF